MDPILQGISLILDPYHFFLIFAGVVMGVLVAALVVDRANQVRQGQPLAWRRLAFVGSAVFAFWVPFMLIKDGSAAFAAAACWHGFQYLGIVFHYNQKKFDKRDDNDGARLIGWVSQPGRWWAYMALLWAMAASVYVLVFGISAFVDMRFTKIAAIVWAGLTLAHYWIDGLIWKMRKREVAQTLHVEQT